MNETLAPIWRERFPPADFGESIQITRSDEAASASDDCACSPYDIEQKLIHIESLFEKKAHETDSHLIHDQMHELKGDLLTMNSNDFVTNVVGQINAIHATRSSETLVDKWKTLRDDITSMIKSVQKDMEKNFRIPKNTSAIAIDDSKIQRKLLGKFFDFAGIPPEKRTICGESAAEINGFEDMVVKFINEHKEDYGKWSTSLFYIFHNLDLDLHC
jgi:hypothetical protein